MQSFYSAKQGEELIEHDKELIAVYLPQIPHLAELEILLEQLSFSNFEEKINFILKCSRRVYVEFCLSRKLQLHISIASLQDLIQLEPIILDFYQLLQLLKSADKSERLLISQYFADKIQKASHLMDVLKTLDPLEYMHFIRAHLNKIQSNYDLAMILNQLQLEEKIEVYAHFADMKFNANELAFILVAFPESMRYPILMKNYAAIETNYDFNLLVSSISPDQRLNLAFQFYLEHPIMNLKQLQKILQFIPVHERLELVLAHRDLIFEVVHLRDIALHLKSAEVYALLQLSPLSIQNFDELMTISKLIPHRHYDEFFNLHADHIQNTSELCLVIQTLDQEQEKFNFCRKMQFMILNGEELNMVLEILTDSSHKLELAQYCQNKIQNGLELALIINHLPQLSRLDYCQELKDKIHDGEELYAITSLLLPFERQEFIETYLDLIQNGKQLAYLLNLIEDRYRFKIAKYCETKIQNGDELIDVIKTIHSFNRFDFVMRHQHKIQNGYQLAQISKNIPLRSIQIIPRNRTDFVNCLKHKIRSYAEFKKICDVAEIKEFDQQQKFVAECVPAIYFEFCLEHGLPLPLPLQSSFVQHSVKLNQITQASYLTQLAVHPQMGTEFTCLLKQEDTQLFCHTKAGVKLENHILDSRLTDAEKQARLAELALARTRQMMRSGKNFLGFDLTHLNLKMLEHFPDHELEIPQPGPERFASLIAWLIAQDSLSHQEKLAFIELKMNTIVFNPKYFADIFPIFEQFCCLLRHHQLNTRPISLNPQALNQLNACHTGIISGLQELCFNLSHGDVQIHAMFKNMSKA